MALVCAWHEEIGGHRTGCGHVPRARKSCRRRQVVVTAQSFPQHESAGVSERCGEGGGACGQAAMQGRGPLLDCVVAKRATGPGTSSSSQTLAASGSEHVNNFTTPRGPLFFQFDAQNVRGPVHAPFGRRSPFPFPATKRTASALMFTTEDLRRWLRTSQPLLVYQRSP
jgi:hypothetical protein